MRLYTCDPFFETCGSDTDSSENNEWQTNPLLGFVLFMGFVEKRENAKQHSHYPLRLCQTGVHVFIIYFVTMYTFSTWRDKISVCLFLPWHQLHLHIWYWRTNSCVQCWSQSDERLSEPCPRSPPRFGPTPPHSAVTWRLPGKHGSGWGQDRPSPWFFLLRLLLLGVCHILGRREESKSDISELRKNKENHSYQSLACKHYCLNYTYMDEVTIKAHNKLTII